MPKYMIQATYTHEGLKGLRAEGGSARVAAVRQATEAAGGKLESMYFAFGENDVYVVLEYPDNVTAAGAALAVAAPGTTRVKTVVLLSPEEVDRAVKLESTYRAPGR